MGRAGVDPGGGRSAAHTWARRGQVALHVFLAATALLLAVFVSSRALFLLLLAPICFLPFSYARVRLHRFVEHLFERSPGMRRLIPAMTVAGALLDTVMVAQLLTARMRAPVPVLHAAGISWLGAVWFSAHALLLLGLAALGLSRLGGRVRRGARRKLWGTQPSAEPVSIERRRFLQQFGVLGAGAPFIVSLTGVRLSYDFRVEEYEIALPHWPRALDGMRVAHLSDIHVGGAMNRSRLLHVAALTVAARPDAVFHTGDFLTHRGGDFDAPLYEALARIRAPYGQWACLGNHDFDDVRRLVRGLGEAGVVTLRDEVTKLSVLGQELEIAGLDFAFDRFDQAAHYGRIFGRWGERPDRPRLLLNHDPRGFAAVPDRCADLVLSGHTHGGHIGIQLAPGHALTAVALAGIPDQGIFRRAEMSLFVTRCVGFYGYPMRLGIPPEIAILTLRRA